MLFNFLNKKRDPKPPKMKIKYLKRLKRFPTIYGYEKSMLPIKEIEKLEQVFCPLGKQFPKVLREFLYLTGDSITHFDQGIGFKDEGYDKTQKDIRELIIEEPYTFSCDYFWAFGRDIDIEQFYFIDLSEENKDPIIYFTDLYRLEDETGVAGEYLRKT